MDQKKIDKLYELLEERKHCFRRNKVFKGYRSGCGAEVGDL